MNLKSLKAVLMSLVLATSAQAIAEKMPESPKQKEARIELDVNELFLRGMQAAAYKLDKKQDIRPFAVIRKKDGKLGMFELEDTPKNKKMSVNSMALSVRRYLTELAVAEQITSAALIMYAVIQPKGEEARQGLTFEIEHIDGVSLLRFLPLSEDKESNKRILHTEALTDTFKPATVFTEMVKAIAGNKK